MEDDKLPASRRSGIQHAIEVKHFLISEGLASRCIIDIENRFLKNRPICFTVAC